MEHSSNFDKYDVEFEKVKRKNKREFIISICVIMVTFALIITALVYVLNDHQEYMNVIRSRVGQDVIINSDTLMIVNYSEWRQTFTLDNNTEISFELYDKLPKP